MTVTLYLLLSLSACLPPPFRYVCPSLHVPQPFYPTSQTRIDSSQSLECFSLSTSAQWGSLPKVGELLSKGLGGGGGEGWGLRFDRWCKINFTEEGILFLRSAFDDPLCQYTLTHPCHYGNSSSLKLLLLVCNVSACCFITSVKCFNHGWKSQHNDMKEASIYLLFILHLNNSLWQEMLQRKMFFLTVR